MLEKIEKLCNGTVRVEVVLKNRQDAEEFIDWYAGAGEQDADLWMHEAKVQGRDIKTSMYDLPMTIIE